MDLELPLFHYSNVNFFIFHEKISPIKNAKEVSGLSQQFTRPYGGCFDHPGMTRKENRSGTTTEVVPLLLFANTV
jgi:hypothetical protein